MSTQTTLLTPLNVETAPEKSRPLLEKIQRSFRFIPNLFRVFANSPVLTQEVVSQRGHLRARTIETFLAAGYRNDQVLEVLIGVALKTMSNYLDHISPTEWDRAFQAEA